MQPVFPITAPALASILSMAGCAAMQPRPCPAEDPVSLVEGHALATKAALAYDPDTVIRDACGDDACFLFTGATTGARAFVQRDDEYRMQWIAFRGTETLSDVRLDARYTQAPDSVLGIRLHEGFAAGAGELLPPVLGVLHPGYRTWITGHSLGGAMAVITALHLEKLGLRVRVVTYGQPKVTDAEGARKFAGANLLRYVHSRDPVPMLPPVDWKPGGDDVGSYAHFGREVVLDDGGFECLTRHRPRALDPGYWRGGAVEAGEDHRMAGYSARLLELVLESLEEPGGEEVDPGPESEGNQGM